MLNLIKPASIYIFVVEIGITDMNYYHNNNFYFLGCKLWYDWEKYDLCSAALFFVNTHITKCSYTNI